MVNSLEIIVSGNVLREGKDFPTLDEVEVLKRVPRYATRYVDKRNRFLVNLVLSTGLRTKEIVNLNYRDINDEQNYLIARLNKSKRTVYFGNRFNRLVKKYIDYTGISIGPVFTVSTGASLTNRAIQKSIKHCITLAELNPEYSVRSLRYAYALRLYKDSEFDLEVVHKQLGAKDIHFRHTSSVDMRIKHIVSNL